MLDITGLPCKPQLITNIQKSKFSQNFNFVDVFSEITRMKNHFQIHGSQSHTLAEQS